MQDNVDAFNNAIQPIISDFNPADYDDFEDYLNTVNAMNAPKSESEIQEQLQKLNEDLNAGQKEAAESTEGPVIVIAGAGAGKTKTLTHRVASLLVKGVHAANIMVVTFTNKAAEEIKDRIESMVGENAQYINAGTFHSIVFRKILKMYPDSNYLSALGIDMHECSIMDTDDAKRLLRESISELSEQDKDQITDGDWNVSTFEKVMGAARANGQDVNDFMISIATGGKNEELERITSRVWTAYNSKCREVQGIDFDDILVFCNKMLQQEKHIASELGDMFKYVMLDEYQDTNRVQMSIMDAIVAGHKNICVVGDEKQSIYGFREADIKVILSFQNRYPGAKQINMQTNYRSYGEIIRHANACADAMEQRLSDGQLVAEKSFQEDPDLMARRKSNSVAMVQFRDTKQEAKFIVKAIKRDIFLGVPPNEIAILYRNRALKTDIERELVDTDTSYKMIGDTSFFQRAEVKDMVALIKFVFQPWDSLAGQRVLRAARMGVSDQAAKKAASTGLNTNEFLKEQANKKLKVKRKGETEPGPTAAAKKVAPFIAITEALRESVKYSDSPAFIKEVLAEFWDIYLKPKLENASSKDNNSEGFSSKIDNAQYVLDRLEKGMNDGLEVDEIIEELAMMVESNPDMDNDLASKIQLMTIHGSKGLEFDNVYAIGFDNVTMPGEDPKPDDLEESRRLAYVAMTRAAKKLVITCAQERMHFGTYIQTLPSMFMDEISARTNTRIHIMPEENSPSYSR